MVGQKYITQGDGLVDPGISSNKLVQMEIKTGTTEDLCITDDFPIYVDIALHQGHDTLYTIGEYIFFVPFDQCHSDARIGRDSLLRIDSIANQFNGFVPNLTIDIEDKLYFITIENITPPYGQQLIQYDTKSGRYTYLDTFDHVLITNGDLTFFDGDLVFPMYDDWSNSNLRLVRYDVDTRTYQTTTWPLSDGSIRTDNMAADGNPCGPDSLYMNWDSLYYIDMTLKKRIGLYNSPRGFNGVSGTTTTEALASIPPLAIDSVTVDSASCTQDDGAITLHHRRMRGRGMRYILSDGQVSRTPSFSDLAPGHYTVTLHDTIYGCTYTSDSITVGTAASLLAPATRTHPAHCDEENGRIELRGLTPGTVTALLGDTLSADTIYRDLPSGSYAIVLALDDCRDTITLHVDEVDPPSFSTTATVDHCAQQIGTIILHDLQPLGAEASIDGGQYTTDTVILGLAAGMHVVTVRDSFGCVVSDTVMISAISGPTIDSVISQPSDCMTPSGTLRVYATGLGLTYRLNSEPYQPAPLWTGLSTASYQVVVRDSFGCETTAQADITSTDGPNITDLITHPSYCIDVPGSITIITEAPTSAVYRYSIDASTWQDSSTIKGLAAGSYTVYVEDVATGCLSTAATDVDAASPLRWQSLQLTTPDCADLSPARLDVTASGGLSPYRYRIDGDIVTLPYRDLQPGTLLLSVEDAAGCMLDTSIFIAADQHPRDLTAEVTPPVCGETTGSVRLLGDVPPMLSIDGSPITSADLSSILPGHYQLTIQADSIYCPWQQDIHMPSPSCSYFMATAFSPNGDGINDVLFLQGPATGTSYQLSVYNRWGGRIFHQSGLQVNTPTHGWDGTADGQPLDPGTYIYHYLLTELDGTIRQGQGAVVLVR